MFDPTMLGELLKAVSDPKATAAHGKRNTIGRDKVRGMIVSTIDTQDLGPETAILDKRGSHPVQRYNDKVEAERGHAEWVKKVKTIKTITELGYPGVTEEREITLVR